MMIGVVMVIMIGVVMVMMIGVVMSLCYKDQLISLTEYLSRIITSHSVHACDGQQVRLYCPRHSTISIQSAFYGRADASLCTNGTAAGVRAANYSCSAFTTLQKLLSECQSHRDCQLPVNHLVFGPDPCPGTIKYLHVTYKCKPTEHKSSVVCEGEKLTLHCKPPRVLIIYTAAYGRGLGHTCPSQDRGTPPFAHPGPPPAQPDPPPAHPGPPPAHPGPADVAVYPKDSRTPGNTGVMMSNSVMTYSYIKEHPETAALLFTSSVCVGLLLTLLAVSIRLTCRGLRHTHKTQTRRSQEEEDDDDDEEEEEMTDCSLLSDSDRQLAYCWEEVSYRTADAERLERMERRDMVIQEIWMNSDLYGTSCDQDQTPYLPLSYTQLE
uniref:SUEL-type lectin domain-containing protein n=1 Tax=Oncorhynchus mykiss TaxID=8022 RepID=A0A8C7S8H4_ONCMY